MDNNALGKQFGERLKQKRLECGLLQEEVSEWFDMGKSTVSQWESGRLPHASIIIKLARKFNVTTDWLLGCDTAEQPTTTPTIEPPDDLPEEAVQKIEEYIELMRLKYKKPAR